MPNKRDGALRDHPASSIFPLLEGEAFEKLVADIKEHGLREPIVLHPDGSILDGRNRYRACCAAHVKPSFEQWDEVGTPQAYVISKNLHRRHLNESQRGLIAARLATLKRGHVASQRRETNLADGSAIAPPPLTVGQAADLLNVSRDTVNRAKKVLSEGLPQEIKAVQEGQYSVSAVASRLHTEARKQRRKKRCDLPLAQRGRNPERIQRAQSRAQIWMHLREALIHLTSLPVAHEVVPIARAADKGGLVEDHLASASRWLAEFRAAWKPTM